MLNEFNYIADLHLSAPSSEELTEGDTLLIECTSDGEPPPSFNPWVHTGMFVSRSTFLGVTQNNRNYLTIDNINFTETGNYQCSVQNSVNMQNTSDTSVIVRCMYFFL